MSTQQPFELAILSPDNFPLLDKMRKDLIEVGYLDDVEWNDGQVEMELSGKYAWHAERHGRKVWKYALHVESDNVISIYNHTDDIADRVTLTASNYNEILTRCKEAINTAK